MLAPILWVWPIHKEAIIITHIIIVHTGVRDHSPSDIPSDIVPTVSGQINANFPVPQY